MLSNFDWQQFLAAFFVLFAIIDIPGSIPIIISLRKKGKIIRPVKTAVLAFIMFLIFYYVGEAFLNLFGVDTASFAVAGSLIIFVMAAEMILDISIFKETSDTPRDSSFFPVVFPLIAGAGALTTVLAIRSQYAPINILSAIAANMVVVYAILRITGKIEKLLGAGMLYMVKKFFGIILLAISIKLFTGNITLLIEKVISRIN
ncbi:MAG: MarC family protein [Alphaproteobacteria bacterium]|nr:MarC family protein [Alphaproteobacteria bacterium]